MNTQHFNCLQPKYANVRILYFLRKYFDICRNAYILLRVHRAKVLCTNIFNQTMTNNTDENGIYGWENILRGYTSESRIIHKVLTTGHLQQLLLSFDYTIY